MPKVSEEYKKQRRKLILDSAEACFAEKGFRDTSIDDIAKHSKTSKGTIYIYFKSKDDIYYELIDEKFGGSFEKIKESVKKFNTAEEKIRYMIGLYKKIDQTEEERNFIILQIEANIYLLRNGKSEEIMIDRLDEITRFLQSILEEGISNGEFREDLDTNIFPKMFHSFQDGLVARAASEKLARMHKNIWNMFEEMIFDYLKIK